MCGLQSCHVPSRQVVFDHCMLFHSGQPFGVIHNTKQHCLKTLLWSKECQSEAGNKVSVNGSREQEASVSGKQGASVSGRQRQWGVKHALVGSEASVSESEASVNGQPVVLHDAMQIVHCDMLFLCGIVACCCFTVASFFGGSWSFLTCWCFQVRCWTAAVRFRDVFVFVPLVAC